MTKGVHNLKTLLGSEESLSVVAGGFKSGGNNLRRAARAVDH